jgi:hypothetical protein
MRNQRVDIEFTIVSIVLGIIFIALCFVVVSVANPFIEQQCTNSGGQVLSHPFHISSCLHSAQ